MVFIDGPGSEALSFLLEGWSSRSSESCEGLRTAFVSIFLVYIA